jgi:hypothetical protein
MGQWAWDFSPLVCICHHNLHGNICTHSFPFTLTLMHLQPYFWTTATLEKVALNLGSGKTADGRSWPCQSLCLRPKSKVLFYSNFIERCLRNSETKVQSVKLFHPQLITKATVGQFRTKIFTGKPFLGLLSIFMIDPTQIHHPELQTHLQGPSGLLMDHVLVLPKQITPATWKRKSFISLKITQVLDWLCPLEG